MFTHVLRFTAPFVLSGFIASAGLADCSPTTAELRGLWGQAQFQIEIADTNESRAQGLMHRTEMPRMSGMLFLYDSPRPMAFWMRNTLIPLDLLFIAPNGEVLAIHERAKPLDETHIPGPDGSIAVLEINGGMAETLGIKAGSQIRHSFFDQFSTSWPCNAS
ncbi:DUF192 domain-containing protein [Falsihalocynthiibacter sp. S25ZX9]|uniref:DUF192 domain-containing protein n=1 Tax=Falsihalocynthiibacter sp. S25ZX9 TaxID=3240870 RepID=UPI00350FF8CB